MQIKAQEVQRVWISSDSQEIRGEDVLRVCKGENREMASVFAHRQ